MADLLKFKFFLLFYVHSEAGSRKTPPPIQNSELLSLESTALGHSLMQLFICPPGVSGCSSGEDEFC